MNPYKFLNCQKKNFLQWPDLEPFGQPSIPLVFLISLVHHVSSLLLTCLTCWALYWLARKRKFKNMKDKSLWNRHGRKWLFLQPFVGPLWQFITLSHFEVKGFLLLTLLVLFIQLLHKTHCYAFSNRWLQTGMCIYICMCMYTHI